MGKIFLVMGKSATGKDTIFRKLLEIEDLKLKTVVTYTTRPIRTAELDGREYFFVDNAKKEELLTKGKVIEQRSYDTVHGIWYYFTVNDGQIDLDNSNYIMIQTLEGYEQIRDYYGKDSVVPIYVEVEDGERLMRALEREREQSDPKYAELCRRYLADTMDFSEENIKALGINKRYQNLDIRECISQISSDILAIIQDTDKK